MIYILDQPDFDTYKIRKKKDFNINYLSLNIMVYIAFNITIFMYLYLYKHIIHAKHLKKIFFD
jgi:hypothetical protein